MKQVIRSISMIKKTICPTIIGIIGLLVLAGCSGSGSPDDMIDPVDVTYEADVKFIMENDCLNCHTNPPVNGATVPLTTYGEVRSAVETSDLLGRINSISNPMPPTGLISTIPRKVIQDWVDQGFPEN